MNAKVCFEVRGKCFDLEMHGDDREISRLTGRLLDLLERQPTTQPTAAETQDKMLRKGKREPQGRMREIANKVLTEAGRALTPQEIFKIGKRYHSGLNPNSLRVMLWRKYRDGIYAKTDGCYSLSSNEQAGSSTAPHDCLPARK